MRLPPIPIEGFGVGFQGTSCGGMGHRSARPRGSWHSSGADPTRVGPGQLPVGRGAFPVLRAGPLGFPGNPQTALAGLQLPPVVLPPGFKGAQ